MYFINLLRKLGKIIIGGSGTSEIYLAVFLGFILGMIPGFNLLSIICIILILILNVNLLTTIFAFIIGEILCYLLAPITYSIGYTVINSIGLKGFFKFLSNSPVTALLSFDNYCLVGGVIFAIIVGAIFSWLFTWFIQTARLGLAKSSQNKMGSKLAGNFVTKTLVRILIGKRNETMEELLSKKSKLIRKSGFSLIIIFIIILFLLEIFLLDTIAKRGIIYGAEKLNGAEVNISEVDASLFTGNLEISNLEITDPENPKYNQIFVKNIKGKLSISSMLTKRFVIDKLKLIGLEENTIREHTGKVYTELHEKKGNIVIGPGKTGTGSKSKEQQETLDYYMKKAETINKYYNKVKKYIDFSNKATKTANKLPSSLPQNITHRELLKLTDRSLTDQSPSVVVRLIEGDSNNPYPLSFKVYEITSDPSLNPNPVRLKIIPKNINKDPNLDLSFKQNSNIDDDHLKLSIGNINLNHDMFSSKMPVDIKSGKASIISEGNINSDNINLPLKISISNINAKVKENEKLFGLNSNIANQALQDIKELDLFFSLTGTLNNLQIESNTEENIKILQKTILKTGHKMLGGQLESQLEKFTKGNKSLDKITKDNSILEEGKNTIDDFLSNTDLSDLW